FRSCIAFFTFCDAFFPYLAMGAPSGRHRTGHAGQIAAGNYSLRGRVRAPLHFPPMHHRALSVRRNSCPSDAASDALVGSLTELIARRSNFGPARTTKTSPDWLGM